MQTFWYAYIAIGSLAALVAMLVAEKPGKPTPVLTLVITMVLFIASWPCVIFWLLVRRGRTNAKP